MKANSLRKWINISGKLSTLIYLYFCFLYHLCFNFTFMIYCDAEVVCAEGP